ncbi:MAG: SusC/RagA family TonB-linked outer membrane protein [Prevotellaceae bacterium]|nr:SusC/RagA family TonB-linked outer membrane protein [Prevotellaceae bacterium]
MEKRLCTVLAGIFLSSGIAFAQTKISGTVISAEDGQPVIGASIMVEGTKTGTVTNIDGQFDLDVPAGKKLVVTYIGMQPQTVVAKPGMKITLKNDDKTLQEVVVTGMTTQDKRLFSGAATKIDASKAKIDGMADISRSLEGRAAGVSVQNVSGTFGTAPKIRVRGATSIFGSSKPLWVVDGVIMEDVVDVDASDLSSGDAKTLISSAIAGLNADDIESFQILKDGSATSIYGARAMAGVIVVTTKKGKAGQAHIGYTGEYTLRLKPSYSNFNIMNSQDQMEVYQELQQKGYLNYAGTANASQSGVYGKMYQLISQYDATSGQFGLPNTEEAKTAYLRAAEYRNTNWFDELFSTAIMHNHSVSISGGTDKSQYYASLSAMFDPGWYKDSKVQRYTANINTTYNINKHLDVNLIGNASYRKQKAPGTLSREVDPVTGTVKRDFDINPYSYALNTSRTLDPNTYYTRNYAPFNIFHELETNYIDLNVNDFRIQGSLDYKPIQKVKLTVLGAVKSSSSSQEHNIEDDSNQALAYRSMSTTTIRDNNPFLYTDPDDPYALPVSVLPYGGIYERTDNRFFGWDTRVSASYNDVFKEKHVLNVYAGMETNCVDRKSTWFRGWGLMYDKGEVPLYDYKVFKKGQEMGSEYFTVSNTHIRSAAFFGTATYGYDSRYSVTGTFRYEGTNYLGKATSSRWLPTWNVSGAWNAHNEKFWADAFGNAWTTATLRLSYSLTGDRPPVTNAMPVYTGTIPWRPNTSTQEAALDEELGNSDLTYEKKREFNIGTDLGFLGNRINLTIDAYWRKNSDLVGYANSKLYGSYILANVAAMKSRGIELSLTTNNIKTKDFSWTTNFIYSYTHNEITKLKSMARILDLVQGTGYSMEGYPVNSVFSIPFMGLNKEGLPTFRDQDGNITTTGIYFQERDPSKLGFLKYEGPAEPTTTGSLGNVFKYKNWELNVFITYSFGNVVRLDPVFSNEYSDLTATPKEFRNRWTVPGDENKTTIPVIASKRQNELDSNLSYAYNAYNYSSERIAKGDFIRMKEISLGYDFPRTWISSWGLSNLSLKLQATNLFLFYADKKLNGQDPEFFNTGGVAAPTPKQFTLTLRLGL